VNAAYILLVFLLIVSEAEALYTSARAKNGAAALNRVVYVEVALIFSERFSVGLETSLTGLRLPHRFEAPLSKRHSSPPVARRKNPATLRWDVVGLSDF
jgi:hypothetical protein